MDSSLVYFAGGPAKLPEEVLQKVSADVLQYGTTGVGVLEISHRSPAFLDILDRALKTLKQLLNVPDNYRILLMPGGGSGQFSCVPLNLMGRTGSADYIVTGTWSKYAAAEAEKYGTVRRVLGDGPTPKGVPAKDTWSLDPNASYLYYCDNETIHGVEFSSIPEPPPGVPLVCDMSSNICSRTVDVSKFGLIFAGAQKNIGCAGVTVVIIREDLLKGSRLSTCPIIFDYENVSNKNSNYNTPPVYAVHVLGEVVAWIERQGGLAVMTKRSEEKNFLLYKTIDGSQGFYVNFVQKDSRSRMNVVFNIFIDGARNPAMEEKFLEEAGKVNLKSLKGHRDVGGMRASIFNIISLDQVKRLVAFMDTFRKENS